ncbi:uncharacterized protein LOC109710435 isoform X1 [Ananas comosus]|uniref:Uncharacterized protein LOC109710435 isoform X1 n=1 Tax=Ananas comosus TaxID=4615 RepID=A0A199VZ41_ANACO|nr:uncharacterized protein LOC109710435 isoform X1 [Ananas comosus]OAY82253.1 hypothetical protein ACMD2_19422 [Ananas comosus]
MATKKGFDDADSEPIFGEARAEWEGGGDEEPGAASTSLRPLLFCARALDSSRFRVVASDFHSLAWDRVLTVAELEDLRDDIGIGGAWAEFVDYLKSSLSSGDVKLILSGHPNVDSSITNAKLIAVKSKGLPRISISLNRLASSSAHDAIADFSLALYKAFKKKDKDSLKEQERSSRLTGLLSSEREKNDILQKQLDSLSFLSKRKVPKSKIPEKAPSPSDTITNPDQVLVSEAQQPSAAAEVLATASAEVPASKASNPTKAGRRVAPVSRRARVRGVSLQDTADDDDK